MDRSTHAVPAVHHHHWFCVALLLVLMTPVQQVAFDLEIQANSTLIIGGRPPSAACAWAEKLHSRILQRLLVGSSSTTNPDSTRDHKYLKLRPSNTDAVIEVGFNAYQVQINSYMDSHCNDDGCFEDILYPLNTLPDKLQRRSGLLWRPKFNANRLDGWKDNQHKPPTSLSASILASL
eukprot:TRINITY_DN17086_c0_g1_i1.p1 TRINITY_DN17086_c0_g1~~TRINITY_DN17086_c0_g1_i1.p1  ORF type:complete len:178 (+),score=15.08 TRINITY_DN17086_c0_g1_i1:55-588(+)